jgi:hypothetical protein
MYFWDMRLLTAKVVMFVLIQNGTIGSVIRQPVGANLPMPGARSHVTGH